MAGAAHGQRGKEGPLVTQAFLKKYLRYARRTKPRLSEEASERISQLYMDLRGRCAEGGGGERGRGEGGTGAGVAGERERRRRRRRRRRRSSRREREEEEEEEEE
eukprot:763855-Hanusia_phi.AAC.2